PPDHDLRRNARRVAAGAVQRRRDHREQRAPHADEDVRPKPRGPVPPLPLQPDQPAHHHGEGQLENHLQQNHANCEARTPKDERGSSYSYSYSDRATSRSRSRSTSRSSPVTPI